MADKPKILLVDNDAECLRDLVARVRVLGYAVVIAEDGITALGVARKERPDVVIMDVALPGANGFAVMEHFENMSTLSGTPIIVLTALDPETTEPQARRHNVVAFLTKPADDEQLAKAIRTALGEDVASGKHLIVPDFGRMVAHTATTDLLNALDSG